MGLFSTPPERFLSSEVAVEQIRNIFCIGRNYQEHANELGNDVPAKPLIFGKSTHAAVPAKGHIYLPKGRSDIHYELEIVLWMKEKFHPTASFAELIGGIALGLDLTDRTAQSQLKAAGQPWEFAKGFVGSAVITDFYAISDESEFEQMEFSLRKNDQMVQVGHPRDMIFSVSEIIAYVGEHFGLSAGDILFTGTPKGVGPLQTGDRLELIMNGDVWGSVTVGS
jgi:fumarylpyruvate hydrolase